MDEVELKERLGRYERVIETEDFKRTLEELLEAFAIDASVFQACNSQNASEYLFAREGIRTLANKFKSVIAETKQAIEDLKNKPTGDEEYE